MKQVFILMIVSLLFAACSDKDDPVENYTGNKPYLGKKVMGIKLSSSSLAAFAEHDITDIDIFVYLNDSLVYGRKHTISSSSLDIEVPLGENLKTFAVANAGKLVGTDSLHKMVVEQDLSAQKEIFVSDVVSFISDKSIDVIPLVLERKVGQVIFQPTESMDELSSVSSFDALSVQFNNVVIGFMPGVGKYILGNVPITTTLTTNYKASLYSFPSPNDNLGSIEVIYLKDNLEVNRTLRPLSPPIKYEASKRTVVNMPILNPNYLEKHFAGRVFRGVSSAQDFTVQQFQF